MKQLIFSCLLVAPLICKADVIAEIAKGPISIDEFSRYNLNISHFGESEDSVSFRFDVSSFSDCTIEYLTLNVFDEAGKAIANSRLGTQSDRHFFRIDKNYLANSVVGLACVQTNPGELETYHINLSEFESVLTN